MRWIPPLAALAVAPRGVGGLAVCVTLALGTFGCEGPISAHGHPEEASRHDVALEAAEDTPATAPFVVVLGVAQDGGVPHAACDCRRCRHAQADPAARPRVASLGIVLPVSGRRYLVDATPDVVWQLAALRAAAEDGESASGAADADPNREGGVDREPLDGVFLTHAHIGHYLGLAHFGREAVATQGLPVWGTSRMTSFLRDNGPWSQLVDLGNVELRPLEAGRGGPGPVVELGEGVSVAAVRVPHREEFSDAVGFLVRGPRATVFYVPDTDGWDAWPQAPEAVMEAAEVDVALLDGTFTSGDELPGRDLSQVRHPFVLDSVERFAPWAAATGTEIRFLHFNHSNPALDPVEPLDTSAWPAEIGLARQGERIPL